MSAAVELRGLELLTDGEDLPDLTLDTWTAQVRAHRPSTGDPTA